MEGGTMDLDDEEYVTAPHPPAESLRQCPVGHYRRLIWVILKAALLTLMLITAVLVLIPKTTSDGGGDAPSGVRGSWIPKGNFFRDQRKSGNPDYNPHLRPGFPTASWFEGWYVRLTTPNGSAAVIAGHFPGQSFSQAPSGICFAIFQHFNHKEGLAAAESRDKVSDDGNPHSQRTAHHDVSSKSYGRHSLVKSTGEMGDPLSPFPPADAPIFASMSFNHSLKFEGCSGQLNDPPLCRKDVNFTLSTPEVDGKPSAASLSTAAASSTSSTPPESETSSSCFMSFNRSSVTVRASFEKNLSVEIQSTVPDVENEPWSRLSNTPEGWLKRFGHVLPLRYDTLSLATPVSYRISANGSSVDEGSGSLHMEKNWGRSFPEKWIWIQGHRRLTPNATHERSGEAVAEMPPRSLRAGGSDVQATGAAHDVPPPTESFLLAGGSLPLSLLHGHLRLSVPTFVFSVHSPLLPLGGLAIDPFWPAYYHRLKVEACKGRVVLELFSLSHIVEIRADAPRETFVDVPCPSEKGFMKDSAQSFQTRVKVSVFARRFPFSPRQYSHLILRSHFDGAAIEFGGEYRCKSGVDTLNP